MLIGSLLQIRRVGPPEVLQEAASLVLQRAWRWFDRVKDERIGILLGEALHVAAGTLYQRLPGSREQLAELRGATQHNCCAFVEAIIRRQFAVSREAVAPSLNDEGLVEYAVGTRG